MVNKWNLFYSCCGPRQILVQESLSCHNNETFECWNQLFQMFTVLSVMLNVMFSTRAVTLLKTNNTVHAVVLWFHKTSSLQTQNKNRGLIQTVDLENGHTPIQDSSCLLNIKQYCCSWHCSFTMFSCSQGDKNAGPSQPVSAQLRQGVRAAFRQPLPVCDGLKDRGYIGPLAFTCLQEIQTRIQLPGWCDLLAQRPGWGQWLWTGVCHQHARP